MVVPLWPEKFVLFVKFVDKILVHKWHEWTRMDLPMEGDKQSKDSSPTPVKRQRV